MKLADARLLALAGGLFGLLSPALAHMQMKDPPALRSKFNPNSQTIDYNLMAPLGPGEFPCKGYHKLVGTAEGKPVAEWTPGQSYSMTITGGANHAGGSCQASISLDSGASWKVIQSYVGNCPGPGETSQRFTLPADTPPGQMLFAWTWFNKLGNREMYMNCAVITVKAGGRAVRRRAEMAAAAAGSPPLASRPALFIANMGNGCTTMDSKDLAFPNPGPDVQVVNSGAVAPVGSCAAAAAGPASPAGAGGGAPPAGGGAASPPAGGGATPPAPPTGGGATPPAPPAGGGATPPAPPAGGSPAPAPAPAPPAGGNAPGGQAPAAPGGSDCGS